MTTPRLGLAAARKVVGHTQATLAEYVGVDTHTVSRWERGVMAIAERHKFRLASALKVSRGELQRLIEPTASHTGDAITDSAGEPRPPITARSTPADTGTPPQGDGHERGAAYLGDVQTHSPSPLNASRCGDVAAVDLVENLRIGLARSVGLVSGVGDWELAAHELACILPLTPPQAFVDGAGADIADLDKAINTADPHGDRSDLHRASARLAALMALALTHLGSVPSALRWWRTARCTAGIAGDTDLQAWICGRQALICQVIGLASLVPRLVDGAAALAAGQPCAGLAEAHAARTIAQASRPGPEAARSALAALDELTVLHQMLPADVRDEQQATWGWPALRLRIIRTDVLTMLSDAPKDPDLHAELQIELAELPLQALRQRAIAELKLSVVLIADQQIDRGLTKATATLTELPAEHRTTTVTAMARRVYLSLPERDRHLPSAQHLRTLIHTTGVRP